MREKKVWIYTDKNEKNWTNALKLKHLLETRTSSCTYDTQSAEHALSQADKDVQL